MPNTECVEKIYGKLERKKTMIVGMIDYGTCSIENVVPCCESYLDGIYREDLKGKVYTFRGNDEHTVSLLHFREVSQVKRLRKNISGLED